MEYMQSFVIVLIEVICFFLFQDIFVPTIKKHKTVFYMVWILTVAVITHAMSYIFEDSFILKEIAMMVILFCSIVVLNKNEKKKAILVAAMFVFLIMLADVVTILIDTKIFTVENKDGSLVAMLVILTSKSILLIIILCLRKFIARKWNDFQKQTNLMRYAIIPFISICLIIIILSNDMGTLNAKMRYLM